MRRRSIAGMNREYIRRNSLFFFVFFFNVCITHRTMSRTGIDISYVTSRVAVMSHPVENNNCDDVRLLLETKHQGVHYMMYNTSGKTYPSSRIGHGKVSVYDFK